MTRLMRLFGVAVAMSALLSCGPAVNRKRDMHGYTALHNAVKAGDLETARLLIEEQQANPNITDLAGVTPLHIAARDGDVALVRMLLEHYADPAMKTKDGWDALHLAVWNSRTAAVRALLGFGAVPNQKTPQGWTGVHLAAMKGSREALSDLMLDWKANERHGKPSVNEPDRDGNTPLHLAIKHEQPMMVDMLLAHGADVNAQDAQGNTPLHVLAGTGANALARSLAYRDADLSTVNQAGKTAYESALEKNDAELAQLLYERMAEQRKQGGR